MLQGTCSWQTVWHPTCMAQGITQVPAAMKFVVLCRDHMSRFSKRSPLSGCRRFCILVCGTLIYGRGDEVEEKEIVAEMAAEAGQPAGACCSVMPTWLIRSGRIHKQAVSEVV
jgi:hypothetical protein